MSQREMQDSTESNHDGIQKDVSTISDEMLELSESTREGSGRIRASIEDIYQNDRGKYVVVSKWGIDEDPYRHAEEFDRDPRWDPEENEFDRLMEHIGVEPGNIERAVDDNFDIDIDVDEDGDMSYYIPKYRSGSWPAKAAAARDRCSNMIWVMTGALAILASPVVLPFHIGRGLSRKCREANMDLERDHLRSADMRARYRGSRSMGGNSVKVEETGNSLEFEPVDAVAGALTVAVEFVIIWIAVGTPGL